VVSPVGVMASQLTVTEVFVEDVDTSWVEELKSGVQDIANAFPDPKKTAREIRMLIKIDFLTALSIINPFSTEIFLY